MDVKFVGGMNWPTHLLAASVGVAVWHASHSHSLSTDGSTSPQVSQSSITKSPAEAEILRRLAESHEAERSRQEEISKSEKSPETVDTRPWSQVLLEMRKQHVAKTQVELDALLKRAKDFEKVEDLRIPLREALLERGNNDTAIAIFLEWHRRDPGEAFNELAVRAQWSEKVLTKDAIILFLKPEELLSQLSARNRSADFRENITRELGSYLVETDDIAGLSRYYAKLDPVSADNLLSAFVDRQWEPQDPAATLDFVSHQMDENLRKALVSKLADRSIYSSSRDSSERFVSPLLRKFLNEEQLADLKERAEIYARTPHGGCCGGGEDEYDGLTDQQVVEKAMLEKTPDAFDLAVGAMLMHDKDYVQLFAAGRISGDEALRDMMAAIPGSVDHENEIRRAIYQQFAEWNPKAAVAWATGHLTDEELQSVSLKYGESSSTDPRALYKLELMEALPSKFADGVFWGGLPKALYRDLEDWREIDPSAVELALKRSPEAIVVAEGLKVEPKDSVDASALLPPPLPDEEINTNTPAEEP